MALTREHVLDWVDRYGEAWKQQSVEAILELFTEDGIYVERPYDLENGIYRGHEGIKGYWIAHIQGRERNVQFTNIKEDLVLDAEKCQAVAKWEAVFEVRPSAEKPWKKVQFLQVAKLCFEEELRRVRHFEEYWHARSFQRAAKGLRRLRCRRGAKRRPRQPDQEGFEVPLGPFEAAEAAVVELPSGSDFAVPVVRNALSKLNVDSDFLAWYRRVVGYLVEESDVRGVPVLKPPGLFLWSELCHFLSAAVGGEWVALPSAQHGPEHLEPRSSASPLLFKLLSKWITSPRDLPKVLQRGGVLHGAAKRPVALVRSQELQVHEVHAAHATQRESEEFQQEMVEIYLRLCRELLRLRASVVLAPGRKSIRVSLPGGEMEVAAVKKLGAEVATSFNVTYSNVGAENLVCHLSYCYASSRLMAAAICGHSDRIGCFFPPRVAPVQVVLIPMIEYQDRGKDESARRRVQQLSDYCQEATRHLMEMKIRARCEDVNETPGKKIRYWVGCGIPLLLTARYLGETSAAVRMTSRDDPGLDVSIEATAHELSIASEKLLQEIQDRL